MAELGASGAPSARQDYTVFRAAVEQGSASDVAFDHGQDGIPSSQLENAPSDFGLVRASTLATTASRTELLISLFVVSACLPMKLFVHVGP